MIEGERMMVKRNRDGHVHTPFCRHGSQDVLEGYVEEAINNGIEELSFTEHFLLPEGIATKAFIEECSLLKEEVPIYIEAIRKLKVQYANKIKINIGFEVDYIENKEQEIKGWLNEFGELIEDSILSVHFVLYNDRYYAIDCLDGFEALLKEIGSVEKIYELYYKTLLKSICCDLGQYKPRRIGHPTLIRIFNKKYPIDYNDQGLFETILEAIKDNHLSIDFNSAGIRKTYCKEPYPSGEFLKNAIQKGILLIPGSDAHEIKHMQYLSYLKDFM